MCSLHGKNYARNLLGLLLCNRHFLGLCSFLCVWSLSAGEFILVEEWLETIAFAEAGIARGTFCLSPASWWGFPATDCLSLQLLDSLSSIVLHCLVTPVSYHL